MDFIRHLPAFTARNRTHQIQAQAQARTGYHLGSSAAVELIKNRALVSRINTNGLVLLSVRSTDYVFNARNELGSGYFKFNSDSTQPNLTL